MSEVSIFTIARPTDIDSAEKGNVPAHRAASMSKGRAVDRDAPNFV